MKRCPFCNQEIQETAHHCHHCNSMVLDMDGNPTSITPQSSSPNQKIEWLDMAMRGLVMIFFTIQFFIDGILLLRLVFGITILAMDSTAMVLLNLFLLILSATAAWFIAPPIIRWAKHNFARVTK